jgi:hypothetical protein
MQYRESQNRELVIEGLTDAGRTDLIGNGRQFLVPAIDRGAYKYALKHSRTKKIM